MIGLAFVPFAATPLTASASIFTFTNIATAFTLGSTILGTVAQVQQSRRNAQNLKTASLWDKQRKDMQKKQEIIRANNAARKLMSEKRASVGARGAKLATGSTLLDTQNVLDELADAQYWIEKNYTSSLMATDAELAASLHKESYAQTSSVIGGVANLGLQTYMATRTV